MEKKKKGFGKIIAAIVVAALIGGVVWYYSDKERGDDYKGILITETTDVSGRNHVSLSPPNRDDMTANGLKKLLRGELSILLFKEPGYVPAHTEGHPGVFVFDNINLEEEGDTGYTGWIQNINAKIINTGTLPIKTPKGLGKGHNFGFYYYKNNDTEIEVNTYEDLEPYNEGGFTKWGEAFDPNFGGAVQVHPVGEKDCESAETLDPGDYCNSSVSFRLPISINGSAVGFGMMGESFCENMECDKTKFHAMTLVDYNVNPGDGERQAYKIDGFDGSLGGGEVVLTTGEFGREHRFVVEKGGYYDGFYWQLNAVNMGGDGSGFARMTATVGGEGLSEVARCYVGDFYNKNRSLGIGKEDTLSRYDVGFVDSGIDFPLINDVDVPPAIGNYIFGGSARMALTSPVWNESSVCEGYYRFRNKAHDETEGVHEPRYLPAGTEIVLNVYLENGMGYAGGSKSNWSGYIEARRRTGSKDFKLRDGYVVLVPRNDSELSNLEGIKYCGPVQGWSAWFYQSVLAANQSGARGGAQLANVKRKKWLKQIPIELTIGEFFPEWFDSYGTNKFYYDEHCNRRADTEFGNRLVHYGCFPGSDCARTNKSQGNVCPPDNSPCPLLPVIYWGFEK